MNERLLQLYCRAQAAKVVLRESLYPSREGDTIYEPSTRFEGQAGLSKLAITVILLGVAVALTLAVVAIVGPRLISLAQRTGEQIDSVPLDWGP